MFIFEDLPSISSDQIIFFSRIILFHWISFPNSPTTLQFILYFRYEYCWLL